MLWCIIKTVKEEQKQRRTKEMKRTPKQIAEDIFYGRDDKAKKELEKMIGCKFCDMTIEQRRIGCAALSAFDGVWNK